MTDTFRTEGARRGPYARPVATRSAAQRPDADEGIRRLGYRPRAPYQLDIEIFSVSDLRHREGGKNVHLTHRYEFHTLLCVTKGTCTHMVDFNSISCRPGSLLILRPGQAHNYGHGEDWDGWNILFRPEFISPASAMSGSLKPAADFQSLPEHMLLGSDELRKVTGAIRQMREDTRIHGPVEDVHALLRHQLYALLTRLGILHGGHDAQKPRSPQFERFKRFQLMVEKHFAEWHQVAEYANRLGYTEKNLARTVKAATGMAAKAFIAARINLEAKRLLAHTDMPVSAIAFRLGFAEATNFGKFFRRETSCAPAEFRRLQGIRND